MDELKSKGNWSKIKEELKDRYAILTDEDLQYEEGQEERLLDTLQEKLGMTKKEVKDLLREI